MAVVNISDLSPNLEKKAESELQEKANWREGDVHALRDMVVRSDIVINACLDDRFLLRFLRARKFDYDKAFELLIKYYKTRSDNPELFKKFYPSTVKNVFDNNFQGILPDKDPQGRVVLVFRAGIWDPDKCTVDDIFRANIMSLEIAIEDEATQVNGIVAVVDLQGLCLQQYKYFTPNYLKRIISLIQDAFPARFKAFHIVHESKFVDMLHTLVRPFLNHKIRDRIHFHHDSLASLHEHVPSSILPLELGGKKGNFNNSDWYNILLSYEDMFIERNKFGLIDGANIQQVDTFHSMLGTYKRVCID